MVINMELCRESLIGSAAIRFWVRVLALWRESFIGSVFDRVAGALGRVWEKSLLSRLFLVQGGVYRDWEGSGAYRFADLLINAVPNALRRLYRRFEAAFEGSFIMRALLYTGERSVPLISWFFLMLLVIPQDYWNNMYSFALAALIFVLYMVGCMRRGERVFDLGALGPYPVFFAVIVAVFVPLSIDVMSSLRFFFFHLTCMLAVLVIVSSVRTADDLKRIVIFASVGVLIASLYGLFQRRLGIEVDIMLVDITRSADTPGRVFSFFENPNCFAAILVMVVPMTLSLGIYGRGAVRTFSWVVCAFAVINLLLTYSRGGWAAFVVAIAVFILLLRPRLIPVFVLLGLAALPVLPDSIFNRIMSMFNSSDTSISSRGYLYSATRLLIMQNPVWAVGLGTDVVAEAVDKHELYKATALYIHSHNLYLQVAAETGVFGILAFLGTMITGIKSGIRAVTDKRGDKALRGITAGAVSGLAGILVYGFGDYPWSYPRVMLVFWLVFAILIAGAKIAKSETEQEAEV